ncbi:class F sortase [Salinactinospora qingdaonensis]|uniref:Class F sortase n=1 Tax=Salinactinospora qingdaonensis TaxID=702744 RepID=A0ABP7GFV3_9ACTN
MIPVRTPGGHRRIRAVATASLGTLGVVLLAAGLWPGLSGAPQPPPADEASHASSPQSAPPDTAATAALAEPGRVEPVRLRIPAIEVATSRLVPLGVREDGELEVPRDYDAVGWYRGGPWPGQPGPAVMGAHVDSDTGPAVFYRLGELRPGDTITVERAEGEAPVFTVYAVQRYRKEDFATGQVYGSTGGRPELRLITCGGGFDEATQTYESNTVVYAALSGARPAP